VIAVAAPAAERLNPGKPAGSISRHSTPLDTEALNAMLRADRDKDGMLSREELEHHDMILARRFRDADADRDGKLTFYEFEKLLLPPESSAQR
jgi:Ca2+-binding EF-hand superfamily protein